MKNSIFWAVINYISRAALTVAASILTNLRFVEVIYVCTASTIKQGKLFCDHRKRPMSGGASRKFFDLQISAPLL